MSYDEQPDPLQESYQEYAKLEKKLAAKDAELARLRGVEEAAKYMETVLSDSMDALIQHTCVVHPDQAREQNWWELRCKGRDAKAKFRAMLAALPSPAEAGEKPTEWRPMESAPKNGTEVLIAVRIRAGVAGKMLVGHFMPGGHCIEDHPAIEAGWYFWNGSMFDEASEPVAWMPLPATPSDAKAGERA